MTVSTIMATISLQLLLLFLFPAVSLAMTFHGSQAKALDLTNRYTLQIWTFSNFSDWRVDRLPLARFRTQSGGNFYSQL